MIRRRTLLKSGGVNYRKQYLTFVSLEDNNTIGWKKNDSWASNRLILVSTNDGETWLQISSSYNGNTIATLNKEDKLLVKYCNNDVYYDSYFTSTGYFDVEGNIMSLTTSGDFTTATTLRTRSAFDGLFKNCKIKSAKNLVLPATTLADSCYSSMFSGCSQLTSAPALPATTLASYCYTGMFSGCSQLTYIKCLATDISASNCTSNWVNGVAASGTFTKAASMNGWTTGVDGIPSGWTVQDAS